MAAALLRHAAAGRRLDDRQALALHACDDLQALMELAADIRDAGFPQSISYSPKVFIPLTHLCRDVCRYCTFARSPQRGARAYLTLEEVVAVAEAGKAAGCTEALFTLGDRPESRFRAARDELGQLDHPSTLSYLAAAARRVFETTGLLPHLNPGLMSGEELDLLRPVAASMGIMLETAAERLSARGGPHFGCPDKWPARRLETIRMAGERSIAFTSGLLIGIGETRLERIEAMLALRALHERHGHLQEVIVQNFRPKAGTPMAGSAEPPVEDHLWTIAVARIVFGPGVSVQAPPNLARGDLHRFVAAGLNDWGGVSPVTKDFVNPEAAWPSLAALRRATEAAGRVLVRRLPVYPPYLRDSARWLALPIAKAAVRLVDGDGFVREAAWMPGSLQPIPEHERPPPRKAIPAPVSAFGRTLDRAVAGIVDENTIVSLLAARGDRFDAVCQAADQLRRSVNGDRVSYVVNRNINYTNICSYRCRFCAFAKGRSSAQLRGPGYDLSLDEIAQRAREAWERGATEVCMQGGIHPRYTGQTYIDICRAVKAAVPAMHVHAFSPLEVHQGARTLGISLRDFLERLAGAGLGTLPGTAAEILDDEVRQIICPDKVSTRQWLDVVETAHGVGLRTTATILFGHVEQPVHVARHLLHIRELQSRTGGFTEFVPLPFVAMESPLYLKGGARSGPTFREVVLMHAVARIALHGYIENIQASWVKAGPDGAAVCLSAGANDLGGTLMDESISRAAGAAHGQQLTADRMQSLIRDAGRQPWQRTTLYAPATPARSTGSAVAVRRPVHIAVRATGADEGMTHALAK